jgi:hypothetical protein
MANGLIILDRDSEGGTSTQMRRHMRNNMRNNYRNQIAGGSVSMKDEAKEAYKKGYEEGWKDCEEETKGSEEYRRSRDSHGRYM